MCCIVGNVGTRFWHGRKKCNISDSAWGLSVLHFKIPHCKIGWLYWWTNGWPVLKVQYRGAKTWLFTSGECLYTVCVSESRNHAVRNSTWHLSGPGNGSSLFSNSPAPWCRCSFCHCGETRPQGFLLPTCLLSQLSLVLRFLPILRSYIPSFYSSPPFSLAPAFSCTLLPPVPFYFLLSLSFCRAQLHLLLLSSLLLWDCAWSFDIKISSPHCCPVFPSSRPCNIKVRGDGPAVFTERLFAAEGGKKDGAGEGKAMSPTAEPARWMHFD